MTTTASPRSDAGRSNTGIGRRAAALALVVFLLLSCPIGLMPPASSDPTVRDNGDMTMSIVWDFDDEADYALYDTSVRGGFGQLMATMGTADENSTAEYALGARDNIDLQAVPDAMVVENTSLPVLSMELQPGPEGIDCYLDEWFPSWTPPDGGDLHLSGQYDPVPGSSRRSRIVMQFDLSAVPAGAIVKEATLHLWQRLGKGAALSYTIHALEAAWDEAEVSWRMRDASHSWNLVGGDFSSEPFAWGTIANRVGWHQFDLTRLVDLWVRNATANFGFIIVSEPTAADTTKIFTDCEITNKPEQRPRLRIDYTLGAVTGTYQSTPIGPGRNSTFTSATWASDTYSKASDEFEHSSLSSKWLWTRDPALSGGSVSISPEGWLNVTASPSTFLPNATAGCNLLYQTITGHFTAETKLRASLSTATMGTGLMLLYDDRTWLAIYISGARDSEKVTAQASRGGGLQTIGTMAWPGDSAHLRLDRGAGGYLLLASPDGSSWALVGSHTPSYDYPMRVRVGVFLFSGPPGQQASAAFDYVRIMPTTEGAVVTSLSVRTGNSTSEADPSWGMWSAPLAPPTGASVDSPGSYIQYRVVLSSSYDWLTPVFRGFECRYLTFAKNGTIVTGVMVPPAFEKWESMAVTHSIPSGGIDYFYSADHGRSWTRLGSGDSFVLSVSVPTLMIRAELHTNDTAVSPSIDRLELVYRVTHTGFYISVPAVVHAGAPFSVYIEPKDAYNNTASWRGTVTLHAVDTSGTADASSELAVTQAEVPVSGRLTIPNQAYYVAEAIRVRVTGGGLIALSNTIIVLPGAPASVAIDPSVGVLPPGTTTTFTARLLDAYGNAIPGAEFEWTADVWLGTLNSTRGPSVSLTTVLSESVGHLSVTSSGFAASLLIAVTGSGRPPRIANDIPVQTRPEDFGMWTLDLSPYVSDSEDDLSRLRWYAVRESVVSISGENRTGNMVVTFTTKKDVFGVDVIDIHVVDSDRMSSKSTVTVEILPVNDPPRIDPIEPLYVRYDDPYQYNLEFYVTDVDTSRDMLRVSVNKESVPYVYVSNLWLTFLYPESLNGTRQTVVVSVSDGEYTANTLIIVHITHNFAPRALGALPDQVMTQGEVRRGAFDLDDYFYDPDGSMLFYVNRKTHVGVVIQTDHTVDFYAPSNWAGTEYVLFVAEDVGHARVESMLRMTVIAVNQPPTISGVPDLVVRHDLRYDFDLAPYISDPDDPLDALVLSTDSPCACAFGTVLSLSFPGTMLGMKVPVNITVSDQVLCDWWTINVTVSRDYPPELVLAAADHSFLEDQPVPYPVTSHLEDFFADVDGDPLTFSAFVSVPEVAAEVILTESGSFIHFSPVQNWYGSARLTFRATDPAGALAETTVALIVVSVPDAPVLDLPRTFEVTEGARSLLEVWAYVADPDSNIMDLRWNLESPYSEHMSVYGGIVVFDFPSGFLGRGESSRNFTLTVVVYDQDNLVSADEITITVIRGPAVRHDDAMLWGGLLGLGAAMAVVTGYAYTKRRKPFVAHDLMVIHNDGFLIGRHAAPMEGEIDEQILSGMLTAVLNFVEDSMATSQEQLKSFGFRDYQVVVKRGTKAYVAVVFEGDLPEDMDKSLREFLETFERIYKKKLAGWTGDIETDFAGLEVLIRSFVKEHSRRPRRGPKARRRTWAARNSRGGGPVEPITK